jgi:hypothetical protein
MLFSLATPCLALLAACATATPADPEVARCGNDYRCLSEMANRYRQDAAELSRMAQRYEVEAEAAAREAGRDSEQAKRSRDVAKQLRSEAEMADLKASEYRSALPHNLVY